MSLLKKIRQKIAEKNESLSAEEQKSHDEGIKNREMEQMTGEVVESFSRPNHVAIFKILLVVLLVASIVIFSVSFMRYTELQKRKAALEVKVAEIEHEIDELQYLIGVPKDSYEYMVRMAKEKLGLYYPDETIYYNDANK